jgi:hypothetical protein
MSNDVAAGPLHVDSGKAWAELLIGNGEGASLEGMRVLTGSELVEAGAPVGSLLITYVTGRAGMGFWGMCPVMAPLWGWVALMGVMSVGTGV